MSTILKRILLSSLFLSCFPGAISVFGQTKDFVVGVENIDYYPYYNLDKDGQYNGYARAILDAFAKSKGYNFQYKPLPVKRLFNSLVEQKIDFKFPDNNLWSADLKEGKNVVYSSPVSEYIDGVSVLEKNKTKGLPEFKKLGSVLGFTAWGWMDLIKEKKVELVENPNIKSLLLQAEQEKMDGVYCNLAIVNYQLSEVLKKPGLLTFNPNLPHVKSNYHLSTVKHTEVIKEFNEFLEKNADLVNGLKKQYKILL